MFTNKIDCNYAKGYCEVTPNTTPRKCRELSPTEKSNTMYYRIIEELGKKGWINSSVALTEYGADNYDSNTGKCKAGYRKSITWTFDTVAFRKIDPESKTDFKTEVIKSNCSFCEKVLFAPADLTNPSVTAQTVYDRTTCPSGETIPSSGTCGSILPAENKAESATDASKTNDAIANYYLGTWELSTNKESLVFTAPDTLGMGKASVPVFRVNPKLSLEDYKKLTSLSASYVDPFAAIDFNATSSVIKTRTTTGAGTSTNMINHDTMKSLKNGNFSRLPTDIFKEFTPKMGGMTGCNSGARSIANGGVCNASKIGICPNGMIEVYNRDNRDNSTISCQTYLPSMHRQACSEADGYIQTPDENSLLSGTGGIAQPSNKTTASGRIGCLVGYALSSSGGNLICKQLPGGGQKCRNGYTLTPIFEGGKLSFECKKIGYSSAKLCWDAVSGSLVGSAGQVNNCTDWDISSAIVDKIGVTNMFPIATSSNIKDDKAIGHCPQQKLNDGGSGKIIDEFGRIIPTIYRGTSIFITNDCRVCL